MAQAIESGAATDTDAAKTIQKHWDTLLTQVARWDRTRFIDDVFARPSVGPTAGWLIGLLLALVVVISVVYAPGAAERSGDIDCSVAPDGCIPVEWGYRAILLVAALTFTAGVAPIAARRLFSGPAGATARWFAGLPLWLRNVSLAPVLVLKLVYFAPSAFFSVIDYMLARPLGLLAGAAVKSAVLRYAALLAWMGVTISAAWYAPAPYGLFAAGLGMALVLGVNRRWSWVERDREAFFVSRMSDRDAERVGFQEDLRDEALVALMFLFVLIPLGLRQIDLLHPDTFSGDADGFLAWLGYFGAELAKSVPFVDWSEVLHVENGSPIQPETTTANVMVFATRATLDLLLIAAVVQAIQLAARLAEQNAAFAAGKVNVLEPFGERRRFRTVAAAAQNAPPERVLEHPSIREFPTYSPPRLEQIIRGGDRAPAVQAEADPAARWAAMLLARRQLDAGAATRAAQPVLRSDEPRLRDMARRTVVAGVMDQMTPVPSGSFWMGSADGEGANSERPRHEVTVPAFEIGKYPVTFDEFDAFCAATGFAPPSDNGWGRGRRPVINVTWEDAQAYISWLRDITGDPFRLPSEAEWEYAARAGSQARYSWGDDDPVCVRGAPNGAVFEGCKERGTQPVGFSAANDFGLHDMHGNVWDWVEDTWHDNYDNAPTDGSVWTEGGDTSRRVLRGGSWYDRPLDLRSAYRFRYQPSIRVTEIGFRVARTVLPE